MQTVGISNKLIKTLLGAVSAQLVALAVQVIATGQFDRVALAQLVGAGLTAVFGFVLGYQASPDPVTFDPEANVPAGSVPDGGASA